MTHTKKKTFFSHITTYLRKNWPIVSIALFIILVSLYSYFTQGFMYTLATSDIDGVADYIASFGVIAWIVFILIVVVEIVVAPIPALILYTAGGYVFGGFWGGTLALIGNIIGSIITFEIGRTFRRQSDKVYTDTQARKRFDRFTKKYGWFALFLLRVNPFTSSDVFSYLAGSTQMPLWKFLLGTILGLAPLIYIQTYFGSTYIRDNPFLTMVIIVVSIVYLVLAALWLGAIVVKRLREKQAAQASDI